MKTYLIRHDTDKPHQTTQANISIIPFGKYKGKRWEDVDASYLCLVADDFNRDQIGIMPDQRFTFKVPLEVRERAREELKRRGWTRKGTRWQYE